MRYVFELLVREFVVRTDVYEGTFVFCAVAVAWGGEYCGGVSEYISQFHGTKVKRVTQWNYGR